MHSCYQRRTLGTDCQRGKDPGLCGSSHDGTVSVAAAAAAGRTRPFSRLRVSPPSRIFPWEGGLLEASAPLDLKTCLLGESLEMEPRLLTASLEVEARLLGAPLMGASFAVPPAVPAASISLEAWGTGLVGVRFACGDRNVGAIDPRLRQKFACAWVSHLRTAKLFHIDCKQYVPKTTVLVG